MVSQEDSANLAHKLNDTFEQKSNYPTESQGISFVSFEKEILNIQDITLEKLNKELTEKFEDKKHIEVSTGPKGFMYLGKLIVPPANSKVKITEKLVKTDNPQCWIKYAGPTNCTFTVYLVEEYTGEKDYKLYIK